MKILSILCLAIFLAQPAFSEEGGGGEGNPEMFQKRKEERLKLIDSRIAKMQDHRSCVSNANNRGDMEKCHEMMKSMMESMKSEHGSMREKMKGMHEEMKEKRKEMRKNKKEEGK